jgi:UDP:flavonoid glycosyltransferase YjiC (YdhE family)
LNRRIVLAAWGSLGDLHPFMAVALRLRDRGFEPVIASFREYRPKVEAEGIEFHEVRPAVADFERDLGMDMSAIARRMIERPQLMYQELVFPYLRRSYDDMLAATADAGLLVTSSGAFAARLAAEKCAVPWVGAVFQPMMFASAYDPPVLMPAEWLGRLITALGPAAARPVLGILKGVLHRQARALDVFRADVGLPPARRNPLFDGQFSSAGALAMYSPVLGPVRPDYPPRTTITGFPVYDSEQGGPLISDPALERFLSAGSRPLVFTLGSFVVRSAGGFFQESLGAARQLKRRAVLVMGEAAREQLPAAGEDAFVCGYVPYSQLFARAEIVVHHGGIGTLAQALRAGRPQLIVPFFVDQTDNAWRAVRLGVARKLSRQQYRAPRVRAELTALLADARYALAAAAMQLRIAEENGAELAARVLGDMLVAADERPPAAALAQARG